MSQKWPNSIVSDKVLLRQESDSFKVSAHLTGFKKALDQQMDVKSQKKN